MSTLKIYNREGAAVGDLDVSDALLVLDKGQQAVHEVVVATQARRRAGTASTLTKGQVAGSNKKPWKQKGTGRARAGYRQSPVWRGGGVAFGPHPRAYGGKVNRKVAKLAFARALSERIHGGNVLVVESLELEEPKTRQLASLMKSLKLTGSTLFVAETVGDNLGLASRNIPGVEVTTAAGVNVYQLLRYTAIVADRAGMDALTARLERDGAK